MKKAILLFLLLPMLASAQYFVVFDIDTTDYPIMKAKFYSIDAKGKQILNHTPADFEITENGEPRDVISVSCPDPLPRPISVGIMVDTYRYIDLARLGAERLVNSLEMPLNEVCITFMDGRPLLYQDFTDIKQVAVARTKSIPPAPGGTKVSEMFFDDFAGGIRLIKDRKAQNKVLVFISDLHCPNLNVDEQKLIKLAKENNIRVYTVLTNTIDYTGLFIRIAKQTNGMLFENVKNDNIENIFEKIAYREQNDPCEISWNSEFGCNENIKVNFKESLNKLETNNSFKLSKSQLAYLSIKPLFINFKDVSPNDIKDTQLIITAINSNIIIDEILIEPDLGNLTYSEAFPFELKLNQSKIINLKCSPIDTSKFYSKITFRNNFCPNSIGIIGGNSKSILNRRSLSVTHPNGKEILIAGVDTIVTWDGISENDLVSIEFSQDSGKNWSTINSKTSGLVIDWKVPALKSDSCLIKIAQFDNSIEYKEVEWSKSFGGHEDDEIRSIIQAKDGSYFFVGETRSFDYSINDGRGKGDFYVMKLSNEGEEIWFKRLGGSEIDIANSIVQTSDSNFIIVGYSKSYSIDFRKNRGEDDVAIIKINGDGEAIWSKTYGGKNIEEARSIATSNGNSSIVAGFSNSSDGDVGENKGNKDGWILKLNDIGNIEWSSVYGGSEDDDLRSIKKTFDGGYIAAGYTRSSDKDIKFNNGNNDFWVLKISDAGVIEWSETYGGSNDEIAYDIGQSIDGTYFVTGYTYSVDGDVPENKGLHDLWIINIGSNGELIWSKSFGGKSYDEGHSLKALDDGGVIIVGANQSSDGDIVDNKGWKDIWVLKLDNVGKLEWSKSLENNSNEMGNSVVLTQDGSYVVGGSNAVNGKNNAKVIKINSPLNNLQSDTSDAVFSIIMPEPLIQNNDIDMGQMIVGQTKGANIDSVICNIGDAPLHVLGVDITGGHVDDFLIPRGAGEFFLNKGECQGMMFEFTPSALGNRTAVATIRTTIGDFQDTIHIRGIGINPIIETKTEVVDFGKIKLGLSKDTTVFIIENKSNQDINITKTSIIGPDMDQFEILSLDKAFTVPAKKEKDLKLRFVAQNTGRVSTRIEFEYDGAITPLRTMLFAEGISDVVQTISDTIDFGNIKIGSFRDTNAYIIKNISRNQIEITDLRIKGPEMNQFSIQESATQFSIESYDSLQVKLRFTADNPGATSTTLESYNYLTSTTLETVLIGKGVGGSIQPSMNDAFVGENSNLELHLDGINPSLLLNIATNFSATVSYNSTLLAPIDKSMSVNTILGKSFISIAGKLSGVPQIATVPMKVGLGTDDRSGLVITEFQLYNTNGDSVDYDIEPGVGEFNVLGICEEGGKRLINPNGDAVEIQVITESNSGNAHIHLTLIETGQTELEIYDQIGNKIETVYSGTPSAGSQEINLDLSKYANGRYYIKLTTPTITKTEIIEVVR